MESKPSLFSADIYSPQWIVNPANQFCSPQWIANSEGSNDNHYREWN
ncbi:hypothetical protein [Citrobacter braakii]|nr:hypothetical protein [Citrobacter braakii]